MSVPSQPTGQDPQSKLLWNILKQLERLQQLVAHSVLGTAVTIADGDDVAEGSTTDPYSLSTDSTSVTVIALLKAISFLLQNNLTSDVSIADGEDVTLGHKADAKSAATDTTAITIMQVLKQISYMLQNPATITESSAADIKTAVQLIDDMIYADGASWTDATSKHGLIGGLYQLVQQTIADGKTAPFQTDINGNMKVMTNPHSYLPATHWSPADGTVTYLGTNSLTCTSFPFTVDANCAVRSIGVTNSVNVMTLYENGVDGVSIYAAANVIYILKQGSALAAFAASDLSYKVAICYQGKGYDITTDTLKSSEQSPLNSQIVMNSLVDTTNLLTASSPFYYPSATGMSMDGFKDLSIAGYLIEGDAVTDTIEVQVSQDEDTADATSWITIYGYSPRLNAMTNIVTTGGAAGTYPFTLDFDNLNYAWFRVKVTIADNTNTVVIKARQKAL
jgi:hypothetical protein